MKIYTEVVWSWDDEKGKLVKESSKSYDYEGPLTLCNDFSVESTMARTNADTGDFFKYPAGVGGFGDEYPHYIRFIAKKSYTSSSQSRRGTPNGEVVLYMPPDALKTSYSQAIGDVEMGGFISLATGQGGGGAAAALAAGEFAQAGAAGFDAFSSIRKNILGGGNILKDATKAAATESLRTFAGSAAGQAVSKATGQILNPHKAVVYQGPGGFRTFSYTFIMVPRSAEEATEISKIVRFFKRRMHPGTGAGEQINSSVTLSYPDEFVEIERSESVVIKYEDENKVDHKIKLEGFAARVFLHEFDHMEGINFTQRKV